MDVVPLVQPIFQIASNVNTATEIIGAAAVFILTLFTPWVGDEAIALTNLSTLITKLASVM